MAVKGEVIVFYYVDDIVFVYRKESKPLVDQAVKELKR